MLSAERAEGAEGQRSTRSIAEELARAQRALARIAGEDARVEAEVLLRHALGIDRAHLLARTVDALSKSQSAKFAALLARRLKREPLSYIVGTCDFYGVEILCTPAALIPRPETELLVEFALNEARRRHARVSVADVGTGSGAIASAICVNARGAHVTASDTSRDALALASANADRHDVGDRVRLIHTDLLDGLGAFDVIVANLPYVSAGEWATLEPEVRDHEPRAALVGGDSGLETIGRFLRDAPAHLATGGALAAEIGATQGAAVHAIAREAFPDALVCIEQDFAGLDRMLTVRT
jgi:release factor glutamine methyltransferase